MTEAIFVKVIVCVGTCNLQIKEITQETCLIEKILPGNKYGPKGLTEKHSIRFPRTTTISKDSVKKVLQYAGEYYKLGSIKKLEGDELKTP